MPERCDRGGLRLVPFESITVVISENEVEVVQSLDTFRCHTHRKTMQFRAGTEERMDLPVLGKVALKDDS